MYPLLLVIIVIAAILMVGIVLIQESKGGGLASNFASYNQIGGVRKTTDIIEKTTWGLAAAMVIISIFCAYVAPKGGSQTVVGTMQQAPEANPGNQQGVEAAPFNVAPAEAAPADAAPADAAPADAAPAE